MPPRVKPRERQLEVAGRGGLKGTKGQILEFAIVTLSSLRATLVGQLGDSTSSLPISLSPLLAPMYEICQEWEGHGQSTAQWHLDSHYRWYILQKPLGGSKFCQGPNWILAATVIGGEKR